MEQVIFLHSDEDVWAVLNQIQQSTAQHVVLVVPALLDRLRVSMLLRLARRSTAEQAKQLSIVSEDRLVRVLAERLGCSVAITLDEHAGLTPGRVASVSPATRRPYLPLTLPEPRRAAPDPFPVLKRNQPKGREQASASQHSPTPGTRQQHDETDPETTGQKNPQMSPERLGQSALGNPGKPNAALELVLVDGYLPNPAATPGLEEEEEHAEREEIAWFHYEIADESHPSQAQQEAEEHEAQISATIRQTSTLGPKEAASPAAVLTQADPPPAQGAGEAAPEQPEDQPDHHHDEPQPAPIGEAPATPKATTEAPPASPAPHTLNTAQAHPSRPADHPSSLAGWLRPMRTIDDLLHEQGQTHLFEWFAQSVAGPVSEKREDGERALQEAARTGARRDTTPKTAVKTKSTAPTPNQSAKVAAPKANPDRPIALPAQETAPGEHGPMPHASQRPLQRRQAPTISRKQPHWRSGAVLLALALALTMLCLGLVLIPSAQVSYHAEILPYSKTIILDARPAGYSLPEATQDATIVPAEVAQFDGILTTQAPATGRQPSLETSRQQEAIPTQNDVDQAVNLLRQRLLALGQAALDAQQHPDDVLGPALVSEQVETAPAIGSTLPDGVSTFQVTLTLHLRAALVRHQALLQAAQNRLSQEVNQSEHGLILTPGQPLDLNLLQSEPAGSGEAMLELSIQMQVSGILGPALTPDQARSTITSMTVEEAEAYLRHQPGISDVSIMVQPKWLNRLPIFSTRIRINLES